MRPLPEWFDNAKLGIFIHWYPASVPAFAPLTDDPFTIAERDGWEAALRQSPYAEWYWNSLALADTPVAEHHRAVYGDRPYDAFVSDWAQAVKGWDPTSWVSLFKRSGARYVIAGTKHHDGVLLWPSKTPNPYKPNWNAGTDLISPLIEQLRAADMRCGFYYSGGLDWTFVGPGAQENPTAIGSFTDMINTIPRSPEYAAYVETHWHELIDRYAPDVLWNDISHPLAGNYSALFEHYYRVVPDGVVNDRFDLRAVHKGTAHADFVTPEYRNSTTLNRKFEVCRGIGRSFGYNAMERDQDLLSPEQLIWDFVDIVARGGNLLLNVGPTARGEIPFGQQMRLEALGGWLTVNGEAIFDTKVLHSAAGVPATGAAFDVAGPHPQRAIDVRFTRRADIAYALVRGGTASRELLITGLLGEPNMMGPDATVRLLGDNQSLQWRREDNNALRITLPCAQPSGPAFALAIHRFA
jgi:alpha-L-fucosidase